MVLTVVLLKGLVGPPELRDGGAEVLALPLCRWLLLARARANAWTTCQLGCLLKLQVLLALVRQLLLVLGDLVLVGVARCNPRRPRGRAEDGVALKAFRGNAIRAQPALYDMQRARAVAPGFAAWHARLLGIAAVWRHAGVATRPAVAVVAADPLEAAV